MADYVTLRVTTEARTAVQQLAFAYTAKVERRVSLSEMVAAIANVAARYEDEVTEELIRKESSND